jgi:Ca-activated chloride channel family protein
MTLANPLALLLWLPLIWFAAAAFRRRGGPAAKPALSSIRTGTVAGGRARFDADGSNTDLRSGPALPWRLIAAAALIVLALARPQGGTAPATVAPGELLLAIDLSQSMLAADVAPSRLARARAAAINLAAAMPEQPIGLLGFAGEAFVLTPAIRDRALFNAYLNSAAPRHMAIQGTDFTALFAAAIKEFKKQDGARVLVILSDGEAEPNGWLQQAARLKTAGIHVVAMGFGTAQGAKVPGFGGKPIQRDGRPVVSRLAVASLAALAKNSGGTVVMGADDEGLEAEVRKALARPLPGAKPPAMPAELFVWPLFAGLLMLLAGSATELPARPQLRRSVATASTAAIALALLASAWPLADALAQRYRPPILEGPEPDPLIVVRAEVTRMLTKPALKGNDYARLAAAIVRYGEVHRGHGHGLSEGVLDDGLTAVAAGQALDPTAADWAALAARLKRLRQAPPAMPEADPGPADPANEPLVGKLAQPVGIGENEEDKDGSDRTKTDGSNAGQRRVGGNQRDVYDEAEWRNSALIQPLSLLEDVVAEDSPAQMFRLMQPPATAKAGARQSW